MLRQLPAVMISLAVPALAGPLEKPLAGLAVCVLYCLLVVCLLGWAFLVTALVRPRVEATAQVLRKRPLASFLMGLLSLGWLFLSLVIAEALKGIGGLLVVFTLSVLLLCALVGLPAILVGLGRRASQTWGSHLSLPKEMLLGGGILFAAGGFPWLGQLLLVGMLLWSCGGAVLALFAGEPREAEVSDPEELPERA